MRILFVTDCYPTPKQPQYCIFLEQQAKELERHGVEVDVYYLSDRKEDEDHDYFFHDIKIFHRTVLKEKRRMDSLLPNRLTNKDEAKISSVLSNGYDCVSFHFGSLSVLRSVKNVCKKREECSY